MSFSYRSGFLGRRKVRALEGLEIRIPRGRIAVLAGANGSGKTTLLRCLLGRHLPERGRIRVLGGEPGAREIASRIGFVGEGPLPFDRSSARELCLLAGHLQGMAPSRIEDRTLALLERFDLRDVADRSHRGFSTGMRRRLALCLAFLHEPELLLLDEPDAGLDPRGLVTLREELEAFRDRGGTALVATHSLAEFLELTDLLLLLDEGRLAAAGPPDRVFTRPGRWSLEVSGEMPGEDLLGAALGTLGLRLERWGPARPDFPSWASARGGEGRKG